MVLLAHALSYELERCPAGRISCGRYRKNKASRRYDDAHGSKIPQGEMSAIAYI